MRTPLFIFSILLALSGTLYRVVGDPSSVYPAAPPVPANVLALAVINRPNENLRLLSQIRLESFDVQADDWASGRPEALDQLRELSRAGPQRLWIVVHGLERRPGGSNKIHFSLWLKWTAGLEQKLEVSIKRLAEALFGAPAEVLEDGEVRLLRGPAPQQLLYQIRLPAWLLVSNSEAGWRQSLDTWSGRRPGLAQRPSFQSLRRRFDLSRGIFLYCDASQVLPFVPEFGYQIRRRPWGLEEEFFPLPVEGASQR